MPKAHRDRGEDALGHDEVKQMTGYDEAKRLTDERMRDPRPGDRFHEMCTFYVKVIAREGDFVVSQEAMPRGWAAPRLDTLEEFRARFAYGSIPGYWVLYRDSEGSLRDVPMNHGGRRDWLARLAAERTDRIAAASMASACL
jgi:hypothetical protein